MIYYAVRASYTSSFNRFSNANTQAAVERPNRKAVFWMERESMIEANTLPDVGLGGWTIGLHHSYDANSGNSTQTASSLSSLSRFESHPGYVRKLPVTWGWWFSVGTPVSSTVYNWLWLRLSRNMAEKGTKLK